MKNNKLAGWKNVFSFTFVQTAKSKAFMSTTIILGMILFLALMGVNIASSHSDNKEEISTEETKQDKDKAESKKKEFAHTIYFQDETGFGISQDEVMNYVNKKYDQVQLVESYKDHDGMLKDMKKADADTAYLYLTMVEDGFSVEVNLPKATEWTEQDGEKFANRVASYLNKWKESYLGLNQEQKDFLQKSITSSIVDHEEQSLAEKLIKMYVPMAMCLILYLCIIMYGQMVGTSVATEKSSKVMELLLTSVRPLAVIVGKVLSMMALSIGQLVVLAACAFGGNAVGTMIAQKSNPEYNNIVIDLLQEYNLMTIFSPVRILLALLVFILGFTFYCSFAGLMGATVNRGEDLSSAMSVYSTVSVIGFMLAYLPATLGDLSAGVQTFAAIFPLSSPFILPAKILTGEISTVVLLIGVAVLLIVVILFVMLVAKIYEMVILYCGNKIGIKQIKQMMSSKEA